MVKQRDVKLEYKPVMIKKHYLQGTVVLWGNHALKGLMKLPFMCKHRSRRYVRVLQDDSCCSFPRRSGVKYFILVLFLILSSISKLYIHMHSSL